MAAATAVEAVSLNRPFGVRKAWSAEAVHLVNIHWEMAGITIGSIVTVRMVFRT